MTDTIAAIDLHLQYVQRLQINKGALLPNDQLDNSVLTPTLREHWLLLRRLSQFRFFHPKAVQPTDLTSVECPLLLLDLSRTGVMSIAQHQYTTGVKGAHTEHWNLYRALMPHESVAEVLQIWKQTTAQFLIHVHADKTLRERQSEEEKQIQRLLTELQLDDASFQQRIDALLKEHGLDPASIATEIEAVLTKAGLGEEVLGQRDAATRKAAIPAIRERYPDLFQDSSNA